MNANEKVKAVTDLLEDQIRLDGSVIDVISKLTEVDPIVVYKVFLQFHMEIVKRLGAEK